ncbi:MAG: hypothetical protein JNK64_13695 [Myxococcales bacterium]|nr:hypothetical protein [Myxococcales bacterium]
MKAALALALVAPLALAAGPSRAEPTLAARGRAAVSAAAIAESAGGTTATRFDLERAEVGGDLTAGAHGVGTLTLEAIRSAGPSSAMGIDGDSLVTRLRHAALGARWAAGATLTLTARLGLVPDPWTAALADHPERALGRPLTEDAALVAPSDLGAELVLAAGRWLRVVVVVGNGEGARDVERNRGKTTSAVARVAWRAPAVGELALTAYGRDGSVGPGAARSHRLGAAVTWHHARAAAGVELVRGWGVDAQPDARALAATAWLDAPIVATAGVTARADRLRVDGGAAALARWTGRGAAWWALAPGARVELAVERDQADADAAVIPGAATATDATRVLLRVHGSFEDAP